MRPLPCPLPVRPDSLTSPKQSTHDDFSVHLRTSREHGVELNRLVQRPRAATIVPWSPYMVDSRAPLTTGEPMTAVNGFALRVYSRFFGQAAMRVGLANPRFQNLSTRNRVYPCLPGTNGFPWPDRAAPSCDRYICGPACFGARHVYFCPGVS